jgi:large subunit ribosomal protein L3
MAGLIGKKIGSTQIYQSDGKVQSVTVVQLGPCIVVEKRTKEKNGYESLVLGFENIKESKLNKPVLGQFKKRNVIPLRYLKEIKFDNINEYNIGDEIKIENIFKEGDIVKVTGTSKGKGFQGVVKRHGFGGVGGTTHGQSDRVRAPGSIGASSFPSRVFKGQRMAGRMGGDRVTVKNLKVVKIIKEQNIVLLSGPIPGCNNSLVKVNLLKKK